jgi:hypothetical protein
MSLPSDGPDETAGTLADLSLGSLGSVSFRSPPKLERKLASVTSLSTAPSSATLSTPSPSQPLADSYSRFKTDVTTTPVALRRTSYSGDDPDGDDMEARDEPMTPVATRGKRGQSGVGASKGGVNLTLREQEKVREFSPSDAMPLI